MCGIAGIIDLTGAPPPADLLIRMADVQRHRGPDGEGFAALSLDPHGSLFLTRGQMANRQSPIGNRQWTGAFAHRRLAILDLTEAAAQPMPNDDGSLWLVYNGEVYNYPELRAELEALGHRFRSSGDTEVVLKAYNAWGTECFSRFNGMWGIAIWDARRGTLVLSRDRFGVKPLHYHFDGARLVFASEIKAILEAPWVPREPDEAVVADYLVHKLVNASHHTFFKGILAVPPGHCLTLKAQAGARPALSRWWTLEDHLEKPPATDAEAVARFRQLFADAVRIRLRSDVPVGTALSGGIDSSSIVCVARPHLTPGNQKTFSACYEGFEEDEKRWVDLVVAATGVESHVVHPTVEGLREHQKHLVWHQEEPYGTTSVYAQHEVFALARRCGVPVTLDGQGADEALAGYHYFFPTHLAGLLLSGRLGAWWREAAAFARNHHKSLPYALLSTGAGLLSRRAMYRLAARLYPELDVSWVSPRLRRLARSLGPPQARLPGDRLTRRLHDIFALQGLPALLRYEDRNAMAHSVESRLPFMDWRLVAYLFSLPAHLKIRRGTTKWLLRQAMAGIVPQPILDRQDKIGFATPESAWFRAAAEGFLGQAIERAIAAKNDWWDGSRLARLWAAYRAGRLAAMRPIWRVANLMLWRETFFSGAP